MASINFIRMNGLGNDFLIYDARAQNIIPAFSKERILKLSSRDNKQTQGCDQLIVIGNSDKADACMLVYNADGGEVFACGNASRCVISLLADEGLDGEIKLETKAGILLGSRAGNEMIAVDMGKPIFDWKKIPLAKDVDVEELPVDVEGFERPFGLSMGNPHMVFTITEDVEKIDVKGLGAPLEHHPLYPERANVGFAEVVDKDNINLRVFERGAGETIACGTGACAAVVATISRGLTNRRVNVNTHGGKMVIEWRETDNHVIMTGPVENEGKIEAAV